ncbi:MAG: hypothetical protein AAGH99_02075 [Planctomycetota bacterium]
MQSQDVIISSPAVRSAAVGITMFLLFLGSLVLAWGFTDAPLTPPSGPGMLEVSLAGGTLLIPEIWRLESVNGEEGDPFLQWVLVHQNSPAKRLRVVRFTSSQPTESGLILNNLLPQLIDGRRVLMTTDEPLFRSDTDRNDVGQFTDLVFSTQRIAGVSTSPQLHAVRLLSPDQRNFWVFQLTDQVPAESWNRGLEISHIEHLRSWLSGFTYIPESQDAELRWSEITIFVALII